MERMERLAACVGGRGLATETLRSLRSAASDAERAMVWRAPSGGMPDHITACSTAGHSIASVALGADARHSLRPLAVRVSRTVPMSEPNSEAAGGWGGAGRPSRTLDGAGAVVGDKHFLDGLGAAGEVHIVLYIGAVPGGYRVVGSALARWSAAQCGGRDPFRRKSGGEVLEFPCADDERTDTVGRVKERASRWWCDRPTWMEPKFSLVAMVS